jgi:hypothetical protein
MLRATHKLGLVNGRRSLRNCLDGNGTGGQSQTEIGNGATKSHYKHPHFRASLTVHEYQLPKTRLLSISIPEEVE